MLNHTSIIEEPLISVIVPVYGIEKYIDKCIKSILQQTYNNLEILLIDDGSKDRSGEICDYYKNIDDRIVVFHKDNGGLSDARNFGIDHSTGEYLAFIDGDDYIDNDFIEYLYKLIISNNYLMSICSLHVLYTSNNRIFNKGDNTTRILSPHECIEMMCYHDRVETAAYAKLYHKSLFRNIRYPKGKIFEDIGTTYKFFNECPSIIAGFVPKYWYVIRENSIVTSSFNKHKLDFIEMTDEMAEFVNLHYPDLKDATLRRQGYARFSVLNQMFDIKELEFVKIRKEIIQFLLVNKKKICSNPKTPKRDKLAYYLLSIGFPIYKFCWSMYLKIQRG